MDHGTDAGHEDVARVQTGLGHAHALFALGLVRFRAERSDHGQELSRRQRTDPHLKPGHACDLQTDNFDQREAIRTRSK